MKMKQICGNGAKYVPTDVEDSRELSVREVGPTSSLYENTSFGVVEVSTSSSSLLDQNSDDGEKMAESTPYRPPPPPPKPSSESSLPRKSTPTSRLRRKTILTDPLAEITAVQRLVEYFCVITCVKTSKGGYRKPYQRAGSNPNLSPSRNQSKLESREETGSLEDLQTNKSSPSTAPKQNGGTSHENDFCFTPKITARYPKTDYRENPVNPMILFFCFPTGTDEIVPTKTYQLPRVHYFVLTNEKGRKVYGTCLTVMEEYIPAPGERSNQFSEINDSSPSNIEVSVSGRVETLYLPKVLCLISTWPYLTAFREYLAQVYRLATATNVMTAPVERYVLNICCEIPAPPPGAYEIQINILDSTIRFWAPPANLPIAYVGLPYHILFECLDLDNIMSLFCALIMENKIVLLSSQYSILTICSEIMCSLLFPMRWSHLYVPLLPKNLSAMLDAPVPFICGVVRDNWSAAQEHVASDAIVVDLDYNRITLGQDTQTIPAPPAKTWNKLFSSLKLSLGNIFEQARGSNHSVYVIGSNPSGTHRSMLAQAPRVRETKVTYAWMEKLESWDYAFNLAYTPGSELMDSFEEQRDNADGQTRWEKVQEAFLRFFVSVLKDYRSFLSIPSQSTIQTTTTRPSFDMMGFLHAQQPANRPFVQGMCLTQQFDDFITRRMHSPGEPELQFFDQSIDAKLNRSKLKLKKVDTPFVQNAKAHKVLKQMKAIEPNETGLTNFNFDRILKPYMYKTWPDVFNEKMFCEPRPLPTKITAEFDRQAMNISRFRAVEGVDMEDVEAEFSGGDYDANPETGAFTVFLFTYSALVGLEWKYYKEKALQESQLNRRSGIKAETREDPEPGAESIEAVMEEYMSQSVPGEFCDEQCVSDLTMGFCTNSSGVGIRSTLIYVNKGAEDAYTAFFKDATDHMRQLRRTLSNELDKHPENGENALVEYEEAREVATAQLDLAFEVLETSSLRGLPADLDAYKSLMEACGRCGDTQRAQALIRLMNNDGIVLDGEILSCFVAAFAHEDSCSEDVKTLEKLIGFSAGRSAQNAYTASVQKRLAALQKKEEKASQNWPSVMKFYGMRTDSDQDEDTHSKSSDTDTSSIVFGWMKASDAQNHQEGARRRRRRRKLKLSKDKKVTPMLATQLDLGQALLECLYPDLEIDTNKQACPYCSYTLKEDEVIAGWKPCSFDDFTTQCSKCTHRFVPHFSVHSSAHTFRGSQGPGSALFCEFLSPWVVRKALHHVVKYDPGIEGILEPEWRNGTDIRATLFWNLIVMCRRYNLPFTFLLQGSVEGRIILPRTPTNM